MSDTAIPRCRVDIERFALFAKVTITAPDGRSLVTTMDKFVTRDHQDITKLKRQLLNRSKGA